MKHEMKSIKLLLSLFILLFTFSSAYSQRAAAEFITSLPTPSLEGNISIKDGERFVTYRNNYLFAVNFWLGIEIWDISQIETPRKVAFMPTGDMVYHVVLDDNRLYAANKTDGVIVFDISNINRPFEVARITTPGDAYWVDVNYPYLYVAMGSEGFCVMDISNMEDPRTLTLEIPDTWIWSLEHRDDKLFVAAKQGGLYIYNASNPFNLVKITQFKTGYHVLQFHIEDNLAYIADGPGGMVILDISAPRLPKQVGRFSTTGFTNHVFKSGNYAYLANREQGLLIIKVNNPAKPTLEARYVSGSETYSSYKEDVYVFISTDTQTEILRHNNQPVLEPLADPVIDENKIFTLQLKASDPDGDKIYFESRNLPAGSSFDAKTGLFSWTPTYEQSGVYTSVIFTVIEQTGSKLSDSDTITITVNHINRMPQLPAIASRTIPEDSLLTITVPEGSDPDKEDTGKLYYRVDNRPSGATFDSLKRVFTWKPTYEQSGSYIVDFVLYDGAGGADREAVTLAVLHVDRPPVIEILAAQSVEEAQTLTLQMKGNEPDREDRDKVSFTMFNLPPGAVFDPAIRQFTWNPTYEQSGSYPKVGAVMKAGALSDTTYFDITVNHINRPPVLAAIPDQVIEENKILNFSIGASDPDKEDAGKLIFSVQNLPAGAVFKADSLRVAWLPTFEQSGSYSGVTISVKDPQGLGDQKTMTITVNHINRPPVLADISPAMVEENKLLTFQLSATDPDQEDSGKLSYASANLPQGATLDPASGVFTWTPTYDQSGNYGVNFVVSDGKLTDGKTATITVNHVNRPPVLNEIASQTVEENKALTFSISGNDPDKEDQGKLSYSVQNLPTGAAFTPSNRTFVWTPTYEQSGIYSNVLFRVADSAGLSAEKTVTIMVIHVNRPPLLTAVPEQAANEQETMTFTLQGTDPDQEDQGKLKYQVSNLPQGATLNMTSGEFRWVPGYDQSGKYTLDAQVADSVGITAKTQVLVTVANVNRPPVIEPLSVVSGTENELSTIALIFSDPDKEDQGKLVITATGLPDGAQMDPASGVIKWTPTYEQSGQYTVSYIVADASAATASGEVSLQIDNVNRPPILGALDPLMIDENIVLATSLPEGSDPDREDQGKLTYSLEGLSTGAVFNPVTRSFQWTPTFDQSGSYTLTYTVKDAGGLTAQATVSLTVNNINRPPTLSPVGNLETAEGEKFSQTLPAASDPDQEDTGNMTYELQNLPPGANFNAASRTLEWTPGFEQAGSYTLTYLVKDLAGESAQTSFTLNVKNTNRMPQIKGATDRSVKEGQELSFNIETEDPDKEDQGKLTLTANGLPTGANFNGSTGLFTWIPREDQQGEYRMTFTVTDSQGGRSEVPVQITVEDVPAPSPPAPTPDNN